MIEGMPREIIPKWLFTFLLNWRMRRIIVDAAVPGHVLHRALWRYPTPREQMAGYEDCA